MRQVYRLLLFSPWLIWAQRAVEENLSQYEFGKTETVAYSEMINSHQPDKELADINPFFVNPPLPTFPQYCYPENESEPAPQKKGIILRGLVLVTAKECMLDGKYLEDLEGVSICGLHLPGYEKHLRRRLDEYLKEPLTTRLIEVIQDEITAFYEENHNPFVLVAVPPQVISSGVLQLVVVEGKAAEIEVLGNKYFTEEQIASLVHTKSGDRIDLPAIERDLDTLNRNPFRRVNMIYSPGKEFGTTNLTFAVEDRRPVRIYAGVENTGIETMGRQRLYGGINWGRIFGKDCVLSYQYTASYDLKSFQGHTGQMMATIPNGHLLNMYGGFSIVDPHLVFPLNYNKGRSAQFSLRYVIPLKSRPRRTREFSVGFDFKTTNNTSTFSELINNFSASSVNLTQLMVAYNFRNEGKIMRFDLDLQAFVSPGDLLARESNAAYQSLRDQARNRWFYGRGSIRYLQRLGADFTMTLWLQGQYSTAPLLPSEQFGIGGHTTVRGYDERQLNMDDAFLASVEIRSPLIPIISMIRRKMAKDSLQFLCFVDYGWGKNRNLEPGEPLAAQLLGVGPGLRYTLDPNIAIRFDWGIKLEKKMEYTGGDSQVHFAATISY